MAFGSVSEFYRVRRDGSADPVALKVMSEDEASSADEGSRDRRLAFFLREAAVTAQLTHPNIVSLQEVGFWPGVGHYIALEWLEGQPLDEVIAAEGAFDEPRVREIATQILSALSVAHRQGILHRDLKPGNIQVSRTPDGEEHAKLFDFGVAKLWQAAPGAREPTRTGTLVGTPMWMSPEQCRGRALSVRSDVYSVGTLLYYLLTAKAPFQSGSIFQVLNDVLSTDPVPVNEVRRRLGLAPVTRTLENAIRRALYKQPDQRFVDADHMNSYLDRDVPSTEWPSVPTAMVHRGGRGMAPGLLAIQRHFTALNEPALHAVVRKVLGSLGEDDEWVSCLELSHDACSVQFEVGDTPTMTILETAGLAFRLQKALSAVELNPVSLLVGAGEPTLTLPMAQGEHPPLLAHLHQYLYKALTHERDSLDTSQRRGRILATPEWLHALRVDFQCCRLAIDVHGPVLLMDACDGPGRVEASAENVVREALAIHHAGLATVDLEEVLFQVHDPIEVLSAISDLQREGEVFQDHRGIVRLAHDTESLPPVNLSPTERRLLGLRFFSHMAQRDWGQANLLLTLAECLESAHQVSTVYVWTALADRLDQPGATDCLLRALRLSANGAQHAYLGTLLGKLAMLDRREERTAGRIAWDSLQKRATAGHSAVGNRD